MKKAGKLILTLVLAVTLAACSSKTYTVTGDKSDMSGYTDFTDEDHMFIDMRVDEMLEAMDQGASFVVYFGFTDCPWCKEAMPILNEVAKEYNQNVCYINTRADASWQSNTDIDDYDALVERVGSYFEYDDDGNRHLYTPAVFFIKDGKVVLYHEGTTESHNAHERTMTDEEVEELKSVYREGFEAIQ